MSKISINEIAKLAHVSKGTVSRVINNKGYVSVETRQKVEKIIKDTAYVPNQRAQNLGTGHTKTVAVMSPNSGYENIVRGILSAAFEDHHSTVIYETQLDPEKELWVLDLFQRKAFDALIILGCSLSYEEVEAFQTKDHRIVSCELHASQLITTLGIDFTSLKTQITNYLQSQSFGIVTAKPLLRFDAIHDGMDDIYHSLNNHSTYKYHSCMGFEGGVQFAQRLCPNNHQPPLPDVLWFDDLECAAGFHKTIQRMSLKSPQIMVLGRSTLAQYANFIILDENGQELGKTIYHMITKGVTKTNIDVTLVIPEDFDKP